MNSSNSKERENEKRSDRLEEFLIHVYLFDVIKTELKWFYLVLEYVLNVQFVFLLLIFKEFKKPSVPFQYVCAVTGRPAKYRDPVTQLPYASSYAFKVIRDKYTKHLKTVRNNDNVAQFLSHFE